MIGKDSMGAGDTPMQSPPIAQEPLNRIDARYADAGTRSPAPPAAVPAHGIEGRRISLTSWAAAGVVGIGLWIVIIGLI
jgi:hypothetical protein